MVIPMLEAISTMLSGCKDAKVECAKIMLDKVIEGMKPDTTIDEIRKLASAGEPLISDMPKFKPKLPKPKESDYQIIVDENQRIKEIKGLPLEALVEIDGVVMTHLKSIGLNFTSGKVL